MRKVLELIIKIKIIFASLILLCILRSIAVLLLNKGYSLLVDSILSNTTWQIAGGAAFLLCTGVMQVAVIALQNITSSILAEKAGFLLRTKAMSGILKADYRQIEKLSSGESLSKLNTDLSGITVWIKNELSTILSDLVLLFVVLTAMLDLNFKLTLISFLIVPFLSIGSYLLSRPISNAEKEKNKAIAEVNQIVKSVVDAFSIVKLYGMKEALIAKASERIDRSVCEEIKANNIRAKLMTINGFLSYLPTAIMWGFGGYLTIRGELSAGSLLAFTNMSNFVRGPLANLPSRIDATRTSAANASRFFDMLDQLKLTKECTEADASKMENDAVIEFRNVTFGYSNEKDVLKNINFKIKYGSKVAIIGESGCGKSTLFKLIAGLYTVYKGEIFIYGANAKHANPEDIRCKLSVATQEAQLFPVSILENITCGHSISMESVEAACAAARLSDFIGRLPYGLDANVGEYGNKLSGGERQRISLARALAKDAPLLLLDEATSALDGETEKAILDYIDTLVGTKTVVMVTHKIEITENADLVICMKNGQVAEIGTPAELLLKGGYYTKLLQVQKMLRGMSDDDNREAV